MRSTTTFVRPAAIVKVLTPARGLTSQTQGGVPAVGSFAAKADTGRSERAPLVSIHSSEVLDSVVR
jgi:hypothetical protein